MSRPRKEYEAPDLVQMIARVSRALVARAAEGDLEAISALAEAERIMHDATRDAVDANRAGSNAYSWTEIGRELGMTRQAAQQRFTVRRTA